MQLWPGKSHSRHKYKFASFIPCIYGRYLSCQNERLFQETNKFGVATLFNVYAIQKQNKINNKYPASPSSECVQYKSKIKHTIKNIKQWHYKIKKQQHQNTTNPLETFLANCRRSSICLLETELSPSFVALGSYYNKSLSSLLIVVDIKAYVPFLEYYLLQSRASRYTGRGV